MGFCTAWEEEAVFPEEVSLELKSEGEVRLTWAE